MNKKTDQLTSLFFIGFGLLGYFWIVPNFIDDPISVMDISPGMLPNVLFISLVILALILFLQTTYISDKKKQDQELCDVVEGKGKKKEMLIIFAFLIGYWVAIEILGYYIATAGFFFLMMTYLGVKSKTVILLLTAVFIIGTFLFFEQALHQVLPRGIIYDSFMN